MPLRTQRSIPDPNSSRKPWVAYVVLLTIVSSVLYAAPQALTEKRTTSDEAQVSLIPRSRTQPKAPRSDIRADVNVVLIPVTVTDPFGKPVLGLLPSAFHVLDDGIEQPVAHVFSQDAPLSIGFVFDCSKSMLNKLDKSREAIAHMMKASMPGDEYFLVGFNDKPKLLSGFSPDPAEISNALMSIQPVGWTALLDAIHLSVAQMKKAKNSRRALVVLSDGGDNNSRFNPHEIRQLLRESDLSLYAIGITGPMVTMAAMKLLSDLAEETGGRMFPVHHVNELPDAIAKLNTALRDQYMLAYYPTNSARDGKYRRVQVKVVAPPDSPSLHATWRSGYYAPY